jgi:hypothetical protein
MCRVLGVAPSGYDEWLQQPISNRGQEDARLLRLIRASFIASHAIYGARLSPQGQLIQARVVGLLFLDVLANHLLVAADG